MTASAVQLACTDFGIWCSDVNSTADSSRVACHYSLPQTDENALKGGACLCGCSHKVCSPRADPSHNARRQAKQKDTGRASRLLPWLVLRGNSAASRGKPRGSLLL